MEPSAPRPSPSRRQGAVPAVGELVVHLGKKGKRCSLKSPTTFVGSAEGCDVRLNLNGLEPLHCVIVQGPTGILVRDLNSQGGTFVNGNRVTNAPLQDGDVLTLGPVKMAVRLAPPAATPPPAPAAGAVDALRVQAAAVAAQQSALGEEESRLVQRKGALEQQEEQLAAHLEEKRRKLVTLNERAQAERTALHKDRAAYEQYLDKVTGDLSQAQRELVDNQQRLQAERRRLSNLVRRLKQRFQRQFQAERQRLNLQAEELALEESNLVSERNAQEKRAATLVADRLAFNGDYELGRRQLADGWARLRRAQQKWRTRRAAERAALNLRQRELLDAEVALGQLHGAFQHEREQWHKRREDLHQEMEGLNHRVQNQRLKMVEQQEELQRREALRRESQGPTAVPVSPTIAAEVGANAGSNSEPTETSPVAEKLPASPDKASELAGEDVPRFRALDRLAGELADQRLQLAEQWQRLAQTQQHWQRDQVHAAGELEILCVRIQERDKALKEREQGQGQAENTLRQRHQELIQLHQQLVAWRARLRGREQTWEGERNHFLVDLKNREELAETNVNGLVEIRQRWAQRRRQELAQLRAERAACERLRKEYALLSAECKKKRLALEEEKRTLAEKNLALEQFRQSILSRRGDSAGAERRIERLRRRWLTHNAAALRAVAHERDALQTELAALEIRYQELEKKAAAAAAAEAALAEKTTAFEHKQMLAQARHARIQSELQIAQGQRAGAEQDLAKVRDEVERIASALLDEPDPPALPLEKAA